MVTNPNPNYRHPFLQALAPEHRAVVLQGVQEMDFKAGEILFREGQPANRLYLVQEGSIALETHVQGKGELIIATVGARQVLGWSWLVPPYVWHFQARAVEPAKAVVLNGGHLLVVSEQDHHLGYELMKNISEVILDVLLSAQERWLRGGQHLPVVTSTPLVGAEPNRNSPLDVRMAQHPFFHGIRPDYLKWMESLAVPVEFEPGQMLFQAGHAAEGLHAIEQGKLVIESPMPAGEPVPVQIVTAGDAVGWSSFCRPYEWHFNGRALEPTWTLYFRAADLRQRCAEDHHFGYELTKRITRMMLQRLQNTRRRMWDAS